jgi:hypothetical protein
MIQSIFPHHLKLNVFCVAVASSQSNLKMLLPHHMHVRAIPGKKFE